MREPNSISEITEHTKTLLDLLEEAPPMLEFDPDIFKVMITNIVIHANKFCFHLTNGLILEEGKEKSLVFIVCLYRPPADQ